MRKPQKVGRSLLCATLLLLAMMIAATNQAHAQAVISSGSAAIGADFGCGTNGEPPTNFTLDVFHSSADLTTQPFGNLGAEGWAFESWNVGPTHIVAAGSSTAGFNGVPCLYGRGHASFTVTVSLESAYNYTSSVTGNVSGIAAGSGTLQPGAYTFGGEAFGAESAFSLNVSLTPVPLQIATKSLPSTASGAPYDPIDLKATGGSGAGYEWSVAAGSLPAGFSLGSSSGALSSTGSPAAPAGEYAFSVQVTDSAGNHATQAFTLPVFITGCPVNSLNVVLSWGQTWSGMKATFLPPLGFPSLDAVARACGFSALDWVQTVKQAPGGVYAEDAPTVSLVAPPAYSDPVFGGYTYQFNDPLLAQIQPNFADAYPYYYSPADISTGCAMVNNKTLTCVPIRDGDELNFFDAPHNSSCTTTAHCFSMTTALVGVCEAGPEPSSICSSTGLPSAPIYQWSWQSNFTGKTGGVTAAQTANIYEPDPGSGTGGITLTSINSTELPMMVPIGGVSVVASGLTYSRANQTFNGAVTVTNTSASVVSGPLQLFFAGLTPGVTLTNASNNLWGTAYVTVPGIASLEPGQSATLSVQFKNPTTAGITFTPLIYSGSL